jgi:hypothetical protein
MQARQSLWYTCVLAVRTYRFEPIPSDTLLEKQQRSVIMIDNMK